MGGGSSYTPELAAFRWYDDDNADLDSQTALDTQGTAITLDTDKRAVLRVRIQETGNKNGGNNSHRFEFRINAGSWNDLTTTSTGCQLADGLATDLTAIDGTTNVERLTGGTGNYDSSGGYYIDTSNTTTAGNLAATDRWEMAACIRLVAASLSDTDVIQFRVRDSASTTFTDTAVPQLTVNLVGNTDQTDFRAYDNDGSESGSTARAAENTNWTDSPDRHIVVRFAVENNGGASKTITTPRLEYNKNSGGWNAVTAASSNVRVVGSGNNRHLTDHGSTTARIVATGTFTAGTIGVNDGDLPSKTISNGEYTNFVWSIFIRAADVADTDTIQLRVTDGGTALDSYTQTPTITIAKTPGWRCTDHRWRNDDNTEALATWANVQTGSIVIAPGAQRRLRFMMKNGNNSGAGLDDKPQGFSLRYRINNGSWNTLTNSTAAAVFCYNSSNLTAFTGTTTEQLAGPGTFVTGHVVDDNVQTDGEVTFTANAEETEVEVSVQFHATGITAGDLIEFAPCMIEPSAGEVGRIENFTYMAAIATATGTESITEFLEGVLPTGAYAGTTDTWVDENAPTSSSGGTDGVIRIDGGTGVERHALVKFDISSITSTDTVDAAILAGYCGSGQGGTDAFSVYEVTGSWSETTTWNTKPTNGSTVFATTLTDNSDFHFEGLKLDSNGIALAQGWVDGGTTNNGLVIKPANPATETSGQTYFSKDRQLGNFEENANIRLIIVHSAAAGGAVEVTASVTANAVIDVSGIGIKSGASDVEGNATVTADGIGVKPVASDVEANATVNADPSKIQLTDSSVEANATVEADAIGVKVVASDAEGNATVSADAEATKSGAADAEANSIVTGDPIGIKSASVSAQGTATATATAEVQGPAVEGAASVEANATVSGDAVGVKSGASDIEGNATISADGIGIKSAAVSVQGAATATATGEIVSPAVEGQGSATASALVSASPIVIKAGSATAEANATVDATAEVQSPAAEVTTGGGWLPQKELEKLARLRRRLEKDIRERREAKDREIERLEAEIAAIFDGVDLDAEPELVEAISPFTRPEMPQDARRLEAMPIIPQIDFRALAANRAALERIKGIIDRIEAERDDEEAAALLLF